LKSEETVKEKSIPGDQLRLKNVDRVFRGCCTVNTKTVWYLRWFCRAFPSSRDGFYEPRGANSML